MTYFQLKRLPWLLSAFVGNAAVTIVLLIAGLILAPLFILAWWPHRNDRMP